MERIWSSTVSKDTIDEAPMAYKDMSEIEANITPTAEIEKVINLSSIVSISSIFFII